MNKEITKLVAFTFYGEAASVVSHAIEEGMDGVLAVIKDHGDILTKGEKGTEDPKETALRLKIGQGWVPVVDADACVKNLLTVPAEERGSYFLFFDINVGWKYAQQLYDKGFEGNFPTEEDRSFEVDRDKAKEFVKQNYGNLQVAEVQEFKKVDDALAFLQDTEDSWVLKGYEDSCDTVVPNKQDPEQDKVQLVSALNNGRKDYEKSGFLLEKMIYDQCEMTPEAIFHDGKMVACSLDIELKRKFAADLGPNCGCAANLVIPLDPTDPIVRYAFPNKIMEIAKERKGVFLWDASILNDPEDNEMYFGEFCPNRYGWDSVQTEMTMAGGVKKYLNAIVNGEDPFASKDYGFAVRMFSANKDPDVAIEIADDVKEYAWPMYVYKKDGNISMTGYCEDAIVLTCAMSSIYESIHGAYEHVKRISLKDCVYRPEEDILSRSYPTALLNRYDYGKEQGLFNDERDNEEPEQVSKPLANLNVGMFVNRIFDSHKDYARLMNESLQAMKSNQRPIAIPAPVVNVDMSPILDGINALSSALNMPKPKDDSLQNKLVDVLTVGFGNLKDSFERKHDELKQSFKETTQPLIDQNVEKISIMKKKESEKGKGGTTVVSGGGAISSVILRGFGPPKTGRAVSTSVGTAVPITSVSTPCRRVDITALPNNQSPVWYGDSNAKASSGSEQGTYLSDTNTATLNVSDVSDIWFDVGSSGDGISWTAYN